ncbi:MAG: coproporphyrinogen dehydrogenase HemZ [Firmicutes bacterium]|nr:coproporphyrinogen dehydrogenase HemZ [Bacillota bacterium]
MNAPDLFLSTAEAAIKSLVPKADFGAGREVIIEVKVQGEIQVSVTLEGGKRWSTSWKGADLSQKDRERRVKEYIRLGIQRVLQAGYHLGPSPWGTLTGVRPTKLVHSLYDSGSSWCEILGTLLEIYALSPEKAELLVEVGKRQRDFFHRRPNNPVSIYVGIPFCPTRCSYCSFAAYPLTSHGHLLKRFLSALRLEIKAVGDLVRELGLEVESVYLGGGTPTTVTGSELADLLRLIGQQLLTADTREYTVEAGRPETLSKETLCILKEAGVQRISINPQTMHDQTLQAIGREHTVADVYRAFSLARQVGIPIINMDIILGLPGEDLGHVEHTLQKISGLEPDNLTVHSLAVKRASRLRASLDDVHIAHSQGEDMVNLARAAAQSLEMTPYYLYRQRHILGGLENIGYAKGGTASIYNVQMMEERQTIIGLGGGGMTKLVAPDLSLIRLANPKCPATYSQQIEDSLAEKLDQIRRHLLE